MSDRLTPKELAEIRQCGEAYVGSAIRVHVRRLCDEVERLGAGLDDARDRLLSVRRERDEFLAKKRDVSEKLSVVVAERDVARVRIRELEEEALHRGYDRNLST